MLIAYATSLPGKSAIDKLVKQVVVLSELPGEHFWWNPENSDQSPEMPEENTARSESYRKVSQDVLPDKFIKNPEDYSTVMLAEASLHGNSPISLIAVQITLVRSVHKVGKQDSSAEFGILLSEVLFHVTQTQPLDCSIMKRTKNESISIQNQKRNSSVKLNSPERQQSIDKFDSKKYSKATVEFADG